jgi:hypothetical protein
MGSKRNSASASAVLDTKALQLPCFKKCENEIVFFRNGNSCIDTGRAQH